MRKQSKHNIQETSSIVYYLVAESPGKVLAAKRGPQLTSSRVIMIELVQIYAYS